MMVIHEFNLSFSISFICHNYFLGILHLFVSILGSCLKYPMMMKTELKFDVKESS
jgi:hypothetical protein